MIMVANLVYRGVKYGRKNRQLNSLQKAMKIVLLEAENKTLHISELADRINKSRLYMHKEGKKQQYKQIKVGCGHHPELFETLPSNYIKLKNGVE
jgi:antitoxin Phd